MRVVDKFSPSLLIDSFSIVDKNGEELDMGFTPFRKSNLAIYWQFVKIKLGFNLSEEVKLVRAEQEENCFIIEIHSS